MKNFTMTNTTPEVPSELDGALATTVAVAARVLGIGINQCYASVKDGTIPSIRLQGRYVIPVKPLLALLGVTEE